MISQANVFLQKGWAEQEIGHLGFCFVLAGFSCSVGLNKAFRHSPFQARPKLTNQVRSQQCEMLIYFDRFFCCRSSLYSLCIEVSEFEQQDIRNTDCCCCLVAQLCPIFCARWSAAHQASLSFTISWSLLKLMSIESVMPSNQLVLCHPLT